MQSSILISKPWENSADDWVEPKRMAVGSGQVGLGLGRAIIYSDSIERIWSQSSETETKLYKDSC